MLELDRCAPVLYSKDGAIARITLNRPGALNAINLEMRDLLWDMFRAVEDDPEVGVAVLAGNGDRAFSAGADIKEFGSAPSYMAARSSRRDRDIWGFLLSLQKPVIAAIHGFAYGAGCEMSLCCDIRIAADDTRFALPEVSLGYIPSAGGTQLLPRVIARGVAMELILSGEPIDAQNALRLGLISRVVPRSQLAQASDDLARLLLRRPAHALRRVKRAITAGLDLTLLQGLELESRLVRLTIAETKRE